MESHKKSRFDIDIEIKDLFWEFLRRWRLFIVFILIGGFSLTMYQYRNEMKKTNVITVKKSQEELERAMGTQDLDEVTAAVALKRQLDEKSAYMEASELMHINPYKENVVMIQYYVDADTESVAISATETCLSYIENGHLAQKIADSGNYENEAMYVSELISIARQQGNLYVNVKDAKESLVLSLQGNNTSYCFNVKVVGKTMEDAEKLADDVKKELQAYSVSAKAIIGEHQLQLMNETSCIITDQNLANLQNWNATAIKTISNNLDSMKNEMTSDQISLYIYRTTVTEENIASTAPIEEKTVHISTKYMVMGGILGAVLACAIVFALYLFANALRSAEEVNTLYGVKILGCVDDSQFQKKSVFGFIDRLVIKLQNKKMKNMTFEQEIQLACTNIAINMSKNNQKEVILTGSIMEKLPEDVMKAILDTCEKKSIHAIVANTIQYDAEVLETLVKGGCVVFVEKKRKSLYDELYREILVCKENDIDVLGMIVLGV